MSHEQVANTEAVLDQYLVIGVADTLGQRLIRELAQLASSDALHFLADLVEVVDNGNALIVTDLDHFSLQLCDLHCWSTLQHMETPCKLLSQIDF